MKRLFAAVLIFAFIFTGCIGLQSDEPKISKNGFTYTDPFGPDFLAKPTRIAMESIQLSGDLLLVFSYDPTHMVRCAVVVMKKGNYGMWGVQEYTYIYRGKLYMMIYKGNRIYEQKELTDKEIKEYYEIMVDVGEEHDQKFNQRDMNKSVSK